MEIIVSERNDCTMNEIDRVIEYIKKEANAECELVLLDAAQECERIRADYAHREQDEYWKHIDAGTKETDHRLEQLKSLAAMEANKQLLATQQEMVDRAFALAVEKLSALPKKQLNELLAKYLPDDANGSAEAIVELFRKELSLKVASALFD